MGAPDRTSRIAGADQVLQRLIDSLQVLVLVLNGLDSGMGDAHRPNLTVAASRTLEDALSLRRYFLEPGERDQPLTP